MTCQIRNETLNRRKKKREYPQEFTCKLSNGTQFLIQSKLYRHLTIIVLVLAQQTSKLRRKIKNTPATCVTNQTANWCLIQLQKNQFCTLLIV